MALKNLISYNKKIKFCIQKIKIIKTKTLFVHKNHKLIGTIMDSDIRRAYYAGIDLNKPVKDICNKKPIFAKAKEYQNGSYVRKFTSIITVLPLVNKNNKIIKILKDNLSKKNHEKLANVCFVIPGGGKGKRMGHLTKKVPKMLLDYKKDKIIFHIMKKAFSQGFKNLVISLGYLKQKAKKIIKNEFDNNVEFISENKPLGSAGYLFLLKKKLKDQTDIIINNCDIICDIDYLKLIDFHRKNKNLISTCSYYKHFQIPYGIIKRNNRKTISFINEKPMLYYNVNIGIYVISKKIFDLIGSKTKYLDMNDLINLVIKKGNKVMNYPINQNFKHFTTGKDLTNKIR